VSILVLGGLLLFYIVILHILIFFRGLFPLFGTWQFDIQGIFLIDVSVICLVGLLWGVVRFRTWAWWGALIYFGLLTLSSIWTLATSSLAEILSIMRFPPTEMEALQGLPFTGVHLAAFVGLPLLLTLGVIVFSRRHLNVSKL
jgi:hypothetical protein